MPRPKRQKVAPSASVTRARANSSIVVEVPVPSLPTKGSYIDMSDMALSDEEIVPPVAKRGRGRPPKRNPQPEQNTSQTTESISGNEASAAEDIAGESFSGDIELGSSSPSIEMSRRDRGSNIFETSVLSVSNFRRRPRQPSILGRRPAQARSSSVESNQAASDNLASMSSRNPSTLSLGNFKRRPRQPSILGRARSSSVGLDTDRGTPARPTSVLGLGNFRRRMRESSILGTGRKPQADRPADEDEEEDDFNPEDESTPLNLAKMATAAAASATSSSFNSRKRKLSPSGPPQPRSPVPTSDGMAGQEAPTSDDVADEYDIPSSPPEAAIRSIEPVDMDHVNSTMAPPQSSSSPPESPLDSTPPSRMMGRLPLQEQQSRGRRLFRGRTPVPATQDSPISSPPPLTHSPNRPVQGTQATRRGRPPAPPPSASTTAQLHSLLPRRRHQVNRDPYEIQSSDDEVDTSGLTADDDELSHIRVRPGTSFIRRPAPLRKPGRPRNASKARQDAARGKATYGSRAGATSDKENEEYDPDDSLAPLPDDAEKDAEREKNRDVGHAQELKDAAKKFKEVDQWELEFEEATASSSSPLGAR